MPRGGVLPADSAAVAVARQWAAALQTTNQQRFEAVVNPARLGSPDDSGFARTSYSEALVQGFAACAAEQPETVGMVTDSTRGRERYMVIGRYNSPCINPRQGQPTDTFVVHEVTLDGGPKIDSWSFGPPPGM